MSLTNETLKSLVKKILSEHFKKLNNTFDSDLFVEDNYNNLIKEFNGNIILLRKNNIEIKKLIHSLVNKCLEIYKNLYKEKIIENDFSKEIFTNKTLYSDIKNQKSSFINCDNIVALNSISIFPKLEYNLINKTITIELISEDFTKREQLNFTITLEQVKKLYNEGYITIDLPEMDKTIIEVKDNKIIIKTQELDEYLNIYDNSKIIENISEYTIIDFQKDIFSLMIDTIIVNGIFVKTFNILDNIIICNDIPEIKGLVESRGLLISLEKLNNYGIYINYKMSN